MNPTLEQILQSSFPRHELAALADAEVSIVLRYRGVAGPITLGGISSRLVHVRGNVTDQIAQGKRAMLCIEIHGGAIRVDVPVEVVAAGRTASVLRMIAAPLVLRRRMVRDQQLGEALGVAQTPAPTSMVA